jgi:uncharacterized protein YheU (UPF0270 family)
MIAACIYGRYLDRNDRKKVVPFGVLPTDFPDDESNGAATGGNITEPKRKILSGERDPLEDMVQFIASGDGTDYGQHPDSLNPKAMTRRLHKSVLKFKVYQDQANQVLSSNGKLLNDIRSKRKHASNSASIHPIEPLPEIATVRSGGTSSKVVPLNPWTVQEDAGGSVKKEVDVSVAANSSINKMKEGRGWAVLKQRRRAVLTVSTMKQLINAQKSGASLRGNLLLDWWYYIQARHKILSIIYGKDTIFTRPERIMVIGIFFLFTMAINCFLFIFQGNANSGKNGWEVFLSQLQ